MNSAAPQLTEDALNASAALNEAFPELEAVIAEIGAPHFSGATQRRQWWSDRHPVGDSFGCATHDLVRTPAGGFTIAESVFTGPECAKIERTTAQVGAARYLVEGQAYDAAAAHFEKDLGKPDVAGEVSMAAWKYVDQNEECAVLILTEDLVTGAPEVIWGARCE